MSLRYLEAEKVDLPSRAPQFVEPGHCQWCNKPLDGKAKYYCRPDGKDPYEKSSQCTWKFLGWWASRPAYARAAFIRDNFTCQTCGFHQMQEERPWLPDISNLECDHIVPLAKGGRTEMKNLQTLCKSCNRSKGTKILNGAKESVPAPDNTFLSIWLTNGDVAWAIGKGRIATLYWRGFYLPPEGWNVKRGRLGTNWILGECGEMRRNGGNGHDPLIEELCGEDLEDAGAGLHRPA